MTSPSRKWKDLTENTPHVHTWKITSKSDNDSSSRPSKSQQLLIRAEESIQPHVHAWKITTQCGNNDSLPATVNVVSTIEIPTSYHHHNETPNEPIHDVAEITRNEKYPQVGHTKRMPEPSHHILSPPIMTYQPPPLKEFGALVSATEEEALEKGNEDEINDHIINQPLTQNDHGSNESNWISTSHHQSLTITNQSTTDSVPQETTTSLSSRHLTTQQPEKEDDSTIHQETPERELHRSISIISSVVQDPTSDHPNHSFEDSNSIPVLPPTIITTSQEPIHPTIPPPIPPFPTSVPIISATSSTINIESSYPSVESGPTQSVAEPIESATESYESNGTSSPMPILTPTPIMVPNNPTISVINPPNRLSMYQAAILAVKNQSKSFEEKDATTTTNCNCNQEIFNRDNNNNNNISNSSSSSSSSSNSSNNIDSSNSNNDNNDNNLGLSSHVAGSQHKISTTMITIKAYSKLHAKNKKRASPFQPNSVAMKIYSFFSGNNHNNFVDLTSTEIGNLLLRMGRKTMEREIRWKIPSFEVWKRMEEMTVGKPCSNVENNTGSDGGIIEEKVHPEGQEESSYPAYVTLHYYELFKVLDVDGEQLYDLDEDQLNEVLQEPPPSGMGIENVLHRKKIQKLILSCREDSLTLLSVILEQPLIVAMVSLMPAILAPLLEGMPLRHASIIVIIAVVLILYLGYHMVKNHKKKKE